MAAGVRRNGLMMCAMAVMALLSVGGGGVAGRVVEEGCPEIQYVYPFPSTCQYPAEFGTEYHLVSPFSNALVAKGGLTPTGLDSEVRFTGDEANEGAKYVLKPVDSSKDANITPGTRFTIQNVATKNFFAYEFTEELLPTILYEADARPGVAIPEFKLDVACDVSLPCPSTHGARCLSYHLKLAEYDTSIFPLHRDGITYVGISAGRPLLGAHSLPLLLRRVKYPDILAKRPSA